MKLLLIELQGNKLAREGPTHQPQCRGERPGEPPRFRDLFLWDEGGGCLLHLRVCGWGLDFGRRGRLGDKGGHCGSGAMTGKGAEQ